MHWQPHSALNDHSFPGPIGSTSELVWLASTERVMHSYCYGSAVFVPNHENQ